MIKQLVWSFLEQGGSRIVSLAVQVVLARLLAPDAFGVLAIMLVVVEVCNTVSQSGMGAALIQSKDVGDMQCDTALWLSVGIALCLYAVVFFSAPVFATFYGMPELTLLLRVMAVAVPVNAANSVQRSLLQKNMDFKSTFKSNMVAVCGAGALGVGCALRGLGVWSLVVQSLVQSLLACAVMMRLVPWRPKLRFDQASAKALFSYGWKIMMTGLLSTVYTGVSELILGKVCTPANLGLYSQGRKWPNAANSIAYNAIQNVLFPAFSELQDDGPRLRSAVVRAIAVGSFLTVPLILFLATTADSLVLLLLGEQWLECVTVFRLTCLGSCLFVMQVVNLRAYMAVGDSGLYLKLQVAKVAFSCAVIWPVAITSKSIDCTALAVAASALVGIVAIDLQPAKGMHGVTRREQLRLVAPVLAAAIVASAAAYGLSLAPLPVPVQLPLQALAFFGVYAIAPRIAEIPGSSEAKSILAGLLPRAAS